jgi:hypothetical protein
MSAANVLALFAAPSPTDCENAISRALLRIRASGVTCAQLGKVLGCCPGTIENASNEKSLLGFDHIALLAFHFPDEWALIETLWTCRAVDVPSVADRLDRIESQVAAIRREVA